MNCQSCNSEMHQSAIYCSNCGTKLEKPEPVKIPKVMTVAEATKIFFNEAVSQGFIYAAIREHRLPHVKMSSGKILLDMDELITWWNMELENSKNSNVSILKVVR